MRKRSSVRLYWELGKINQRLDSLEMKIGAIELLLTRIFGEEKLEKN